MLDVVAQLGDDRLDAVELALAAQEVGEAHLGLLAVEVVVEVEEVGLEQRVLGVLVERRAPPEVDRARVRRRRRAARTSRRRRRRPACTPSSGTWTLAVGNPSRRPRWSPITPSPRTSCRRPSMRRGAARRRRRRAPGGSPCELIGSLDAVDALDEFDRARPTKSLVRPSFSSRSTLPSRWLPKWKSSPTTTIRTRERRARAPARRTTPATPSTAPRRTAARPWRRPRWRRAARGAARDR